MQPAKTISDLNKMLELGTSQDSAEYFTLSQHFHSFSVHNEWKREEQPFAGFALSAFFARAGSNNYMSGQQRSLSNIITYPEYNPTTRENDIAVVKAFIPFVYNTALRPIPLESAQVGSGRSVTVSGWGATTSGCQFCNYSSPILRNTHKLLAYFSFISRLLL